MHGGEVAAPLLVPLGRPDEDGLALVPLKLHARTGMLRPPTWTTASGAACRFNHHAGGCSLPKFDASTTKSPSSGRYASTTGRVLPVRRPTVEHEGPHPWRQAAGSPRVHTSSRPWTRTKSRSERCWVEGRATAVTLPVPGARIGRATTASTAGTAAERQSLLPDLAPP